MNGSARTSIIGSQLISKSKKRIDELKKNPSLSSTYNQTEKFAPTEETLICRICEKKFPSENLFDHSKMCANYHEFNSKNRAYNNELIRYNEIIQKFIYHRKLELQKKQSGLASYVFAYDVSFN